MANLSIARITPPRDSMWRCPCGYEARFSQMAGHRHGYRTRPACHGKAQRLTVGTVTLDTLNDGQPMVKDTSIDIEAVDATPIEPIKTPISHNYYVADAIDQPDDIEPPDDPEELARRLQEQLLERQGYSHSTNGNGIGADDGDFYLESPSGVPHISVDRIAVTLPIQAYMMYDWAKGVGWRRGDGSISAFIWDMVFNMWRYGLKKVIVVADTEEVGLGSEQ